MWFSLVIILLLPSSHFISYTLTFRVVSCISLTFDLFIKKKKKQAWIKGKGGEIIVSKNAGKFLRNILQWIIRKLMPIVIFKIYGSQLTHSPSYTNKLPSLKNILTILFHHLNCIWDGKKFNVCVFMDLEYNHIVCKQHYPQNKKSKRTNKQIRKSSELMCKSKQINWY